MDYFWNSFASRRNDILLIVCGSAASWMISNIVNNKGGLHNRITVPPLQMKAFSLEQTREYFKSRNIDLNFEQILEIYMTTGGVAYYLNLYKKGQSAGDFINENFFGEMAGLKDEFDRLFRSLFDNYKVHVEIVTALTKKLAGMSQKELLKEISIGSGGTFTKIIAELESSNFIEFIPKLHSKKKEGIYRLIDEYIQFYYIWVKPLGKNIKESNYWQKQIGKPKYNSWMGTCFENICLKHSGKIKQALGIHGLTTTEYGYKSKTAQVDLIIDRSDKTLNLCEMKYTYEPYKMTEKEFNNLKKRKLEIQSYLKRKKQIFITLITPYSAVRNKYYLGIIDNEINLESLF